jgi:hypothetical protein
MKWSDQCRLTDWIALVDQYGRRLDAQEGIRELKRYYRLEDEASDKEKSTSEESSTSESEDEQLDTSDEDRPVYDPMRGEGVSSSSEEEEEEESTEEDTMVDAGEEASDEEEEVCHVCF